MSVQEVSRRAGPFEGDGSTKEFSFHFKVFNADNVAVYVSDEDDGDVQLTQGYTVELNADQDALPGGTVILTDPLPDGQRLSILSCVPYDQPMVLTNQGGFYPRTINDSADRLAIQVQQLLEEMKRTLKVPATSSMTPWGLLLQIFQAAESAATSAEEAEKYAQICEEIKEYVEVYSWDIPHLVDSIRDVENYPYDGFFVVGGYGNPGHNGQNISNRYVKAEGSTELRTLGERFADVVNVKDFGAKGDGVTDDTAAIQAAASKAEGKSLYIPSGRYLLSSASVLLPSNVHVFGDGPDSCLIQPNYYSYSGSWDRAAAVDWNVFQMQPGTENVLIEKLGLRGPFYSTDYASNPVQNFPYSNGILCRGRDYQDRKSIPLERESRNIRIEKVSIEGFAEDGIQLDNVTDGWVTNCDIKRCGRGGVRVYGGLRIYVAFNSISYLSPGDKLNGTNRMYGVTFTRVYKAPLSDFRPSRYCSAAFNKVSNSPYWKGLDTHGGINIDFSFNQIEECHIGIGVDKGGFTEAHGFAPPSNIKIVGNTIIRTLPDDPNEGDGPSNSQYAFAGAGLSILAHDSTEDHIGRNVLVANNYLYGWGEDIRFGAIVYSNWLNVCHVGNVIKNSRRDAICLMNVVEGNFSGDMIDDIRASSLNVQNGIDCASTTINGVVSGMTFINRQRTDLTAVSLTQPAVGYSFRVGLDLKFLKKGSGNITKVGRAFAEDGLWSMRNFAAGYVLNTGVLSAGKGIANVTKTGTGAYEITTEESATAASSLWPSVTPVTATPLLIAQAYSTAANKVSVTVKNRDGDSTDSSFYIQVMGY